MHAIIWFGVGFIILGCFLFAIAGMIDMRTNYQRHNDSVLKVSREGGRTGVDLSNPKARWWAISGIAVIIFGFMIMVFG
jgi:hypothetical protein